MLSWTLSSLLLENQVCETLLDLDKAFDIPIKYDKCYWYYLRCNYWFSLHGGGEPSHFSSLINLKRNKKFPTQDWRWGWSRSWSCISSGSFSLCSTTLAGWSFFLLELMYGFYLGLFFIRFSLYFWLNYRFWCVGYFIYFGWSGGRLVGWLVSWLVGWLVGWLLDCLLAACLVAWLVGCLLGWLGGWVRFLVGWLVG